MVERVAIIGTGLIGGSIGMALKAGKLPELEVIGFDLDSGSMGDARKLGAIDRGAPSIPEAVKGAKMVIVATPPLAVREVFEIMAPHLLEGAIVTDTASTKASVTRWASEVLPEHVSYVGGHPMAGKENQGIKNAEATLFKDKTWAVIPTPSAGEGAVKSVLGLINIVGAEPLFVDAEEHDQYVAAISHLPLVMSAALFSLVRNSPSWDDIAPLAASGFRDLTRLASGDPRMGHDIVATNGDAIAHWIDRYVDELRRMKDLILENQRALMKELTEIQLQRDAFMAGEIKTRRAQVELPSARDQMSTMLLGGLVNARMEQMEKDMERGRKGRQSVLDED